MRFSLGPGPANFFTVNDRILNIFSFAGQMASVATIKLYCGSVKAAIGGAKHAGVAACQ